LTTFEFDIVALDASGHVTRRDKRGAPRFIEELSSVVELEMVEIPGGTFTMGATTDEPDSQDNERPQHEVTVSPFSIGKFTVTQLQWRAVAGWPKLNQHLDADPSYFKSDDCPVEEISWEDAVEFCARLAKRTGKAYRLPTEAQWEYACRAGTKGPFSFGETITTEFVNYFGNGPYGKAPRGECRPGTLPVGSLGVANAFGLSDMHGNVKEWCRDWYGPYRSEAVTDPQGPSQGTVHVNRGGHWAADAGMCRSAFRISSGISRGNHVGFRVVVASRTR
jgi:formylglycine-generating enzyme required for sulfatase activity